jgi:alpha-glucosidase
MLEDGRQLFKPAKSHCYSLGPNPQIAQSDVNSPNPSTQYTIFFSKTWKSIYLRSKFHYPTLILHYMRLIPNIFRLSLVFLVSVSLKQYESAAAETLVTSPNGVVQCRISIENGNLQYAITFGKAPALEPSRLSIFIDGNDITKDAKIGKTVPSRMSRNYPVMGVHSTASDVWNGITIPLTQKKSSLKYSLEIRAYNNGVAYRFNVPGSSKLRSTDEASVFVLPAGSVVWYHGLQGSGKDEYVKKEISQIPVGEWAELPVTCLLPDGGGYCSITEAGIVTYSGMALLANGKYGFSVQLSNRLPFPSNLSQVYGEEEGNKMLSPLRIPGNILTPWRIVMLGNNLNTLVNNDMVSNLSLPPDASLFPQGQLTPWIKPGRAVWKSLDGGGDNSARNMKEFTRVAGKMGFEYCIMDGYWTRWTDKDMNDLLNYSKQQHVGIWLYKHMKELIDPAACEAFMKKCGALGIVGIKVDLTDNESQESFSLITNVLKEAAENKLMISFHGARKPVGLSFTWPNELTRSAGEGMELATITDRATYDVTLPFTRMLAGSLDYTPMHFGERRKNTSWTHQVASTAIFSSPLLIFAASPANIFSKSCLDVIKSIPVVWDETVVLDDSSIGDLVVFARRKGDTWFLAIMNDPNARSIKVSLSFLGVGDYQAIMVGDKKGDPAALSIENAVLRRSNVLTIDLAKGGGFIARFTLK